MKIVYYSLVLNHEQDIYQRQWLRSVQSLRQYNKDVPVFLFVFSQPPAELRERALQLGVEVHFLGEYCARLTEIVGDAAQALCRIPTLHKLLPLEHIPAAASQVLYLDCDTFFFRDVDTLFSGYQKCHWYARAEPGSRAAILSPYKPAHIDEDIMQRISAGLGLQSIPPYNSGVVMMNHGIWKQLSALRGEFLSLASRLILGASRKPEIAIPSEVKRYLPADRLLRQDQFIEYPSKNFWILEQIALWLTLGRVPDFTHDQFPLSAVVQNGEFMMYKSFASACVLAHYFKGNEELFFQQIQPAAGPAQD